MEALFSSGFEARLVVSLIVGPIFLLALVAFLWWLKGAKPPD